MAINKVVYGNQTLIDLTTDTVASSDDILAGKVGHLRDGTVVTGTASGGDQHGTIWQDGEGYVHLDDESGISLQTKTATPSESSQVIEPDEGYYALESVTVGAISSSYVGSGVTRRSSSDLTASGATVTAPAGYYEASASKSVASGTAGTPTATKSAVSNHAVSVTPSVTNTTGYITGSTKTGTAVTVSASELVSGSQTVTSNQTVDVTNLAELVVNVPSSTPTLITKNITANGTYNASSDSADGYSSVTVNVSGGGGGGEEASMDDPVRFFDYDGTLLHSYSASDFQALSAMPANPSHSGLTAQGWNWTLADAKAQVTAMGTCDIGQMYVTDDGKTRLYCHFEEGRLHPYLGICPNGTVIVDWGDNSETETLTGTSLTTCQTLDHEYASEGDYIITLTVSSGTFQFYGVSNTTYLLRKDGTNTTAYVNRPYSSSVQKIELGSGTHIGNYAFQFCTSLKSITIPNSTLTINQYAFSNCFALKHVSFPSGITNVASYSFNLCANLATISIPSTVTTIATSAFKYCRSLTTISIPSGVTTISQHAFSSCYSLKNVEMPNGQLTKIDSYAFQYCYSITDISIPSGVTTINNYAFSSCTSLTTISIPSEVTTLSGSVFATCNFLRSIALPSSITIIADSLFLNCHSLASIEIPIGITNIYAQSFQYCYGLGEIHFKPTTPPTVQNSNVWTNIPADCKIYVPTGTLSDYTSATNYPSAETYTYIEE